MTGNDHVLRTADGAALAVTAFDAPAGAPSRPALLLFPAMGAPGRIYTGLASHLAARGSPAVVVDPRGSGNSRPQPARGIDFGVDTLLEHDWPVAVDWARARHPGRRLVLIGHSLGGMISAMYAGLAPDKVDGLVLLTASHVHWRNWGAGGVGLLAVFVLFAALARALGYLPGQRLRWGSPIARQMVFDWAGWGISGRFRGTAGRDLDAAMARVTAPVLSISFADDTRLGPKRAVDRFSAGLGSANLTRWHVTPADLGRTRIGHFGHLRDCGVLWDRIDHWLGTAG
jgi:predicted alpha/beta hydrolase